MTEGTAVIGYVRVSTAEQGESGLGLEAQTETIRTECARRGWTLLRMEQDVQTGRKLERAGLQAVLESCKAGEAAGLVVAKLDRLTRSLADFAHLLAGAQKGGYNVVCIDMNVDLSTPNGEFLANVLASAAQWERRIIGERTRAAMAVVKKQGPRPGKKPVGRPPKPADELSRRIVRMRSRGMTLAAIAEKLNADAVPTPGGAARWTGSGVNFVLRRKNVRGQKVAA